MYLDELQQELFLKHGVLTFLSRLTWAVKRLHITHKIFTAPAQERNKVLRALYMNHIGAEVPDANMLLFINKSAKDEWTSFCKYNQACKGMPCIQCQCFIRGIRYTILPVLTLDGIIVYDIIEGSVTGKHFVQFLKDHVVCT